MASGQVKYGSRSSSPSSYALRLWMRIGLSSQLTLSITAAPTRSLSLPAGGRHRHDNDPLFDLAWGADPDRCMWFRREMEFGLVAVERCHRLDEISRIERHSGLGRAASDRQHGLDFGVRFAAADRQDAIGEQYPRLLRLCAGDRVDPLRRSHEFVTVN